jgi:hypothetical protein
MKLVRCINSFIHLLTPDLDAEPARPFWMTNDWQAVLIDPDAGRVLAHVWGDECGKYYPTLYLSPLQASRMSKLCSGHLSWATFPRMKFDLLRLKAGSLREAQDAIEALL